MLGVIVLGVLPAVLCAKVSAKIKGYVKTNEEGIKNEVVKTHTGKKSVTILEHLF